MQEDRGAIMDDQTKAEFLEKMRSKLLSLGRSFILGSQLGPLISESLGEEKSFRDFFGTGESPKLRSFVERFLTGLVKATDERRGTDFVYEIVNAPPQELPAAGGQLWRSFVSLVPTHCLVFDIGISAIKAIPVGTALPDGCVAIAPVSLAEHRDLFTQFVVRLRDEGREVTELKELAASYSDSSYPDILKVLRRQQPPLDREWGEFRLAGLLELFSTRMKALDVPAIRVKQIQTELQRDRQDATTRAPGITVVAQPESAVAEAMSAKEKRARELLHLAIDRMDFDQLQHVELPFGVILDALMNRQ